MVSISTDTDATTKIPIDSDLSIACDAQWKHESARIQLIVYVLLTLWNKSSQLVYVSTGPKERLFEFARRREPANQSDDGILILGKERWLMSESHSKSQ
jgi:hypothetical protein